MASPITWEVKLDTNRDSSFGASIDDITPYVMDMNWSNGFISSSADVTAYDDVAPPARLTFTLRNSSKVFNPETLGSELIANGGFGTWSGGNPSSWTVTGEVGTNPEISQVSPDKSHGGGGTGACNIYTTASTVSIAQTVLTNGTSYQVTLRLSKVVDTSGGIRLYCGSTAVSPLLTYEGTYTFDFNAGSTSFKIESLGACNITIDDVSIKANSKYGKLMVPGLQVRVRATYSATTYTLFIGEIAHDNGIVLGALQPGAGGTLGSFGSKITVTVEDAMLKLLDAEYAPPLLTDTTVDAAISRMLVDGVIRWPYGHVGVLLDVQGTNVLDHTAKIYGHAISSFETGKTTLDYLGDLSDKGKGVSAQGYLRDLIAAEGGGRLWWEARQGKFLFHNRHHDGLNDTVAATYTNSDFMDWQPAHADGIKNEVTVNYTSRSVGSADSVVWRYKQVPFQLKNGEKRTFNARYFDPNNDKARVGVRTGTIPAKGVDYIANAAENGGGADLSHKVTFSAQFNAAAAKVIVSNNSGSDVWITYLQLRATPFIWQDEQVKVKDGNSIKQYGYSPMPPKNIRVLTDAEFAEQLAKYWLGKFKDPITRITSARFNGSTPAAHRTMGLARVIGDKITLTDTFSSHNADYVIVGEQHRVWDAGYKHEVTWTLKPVSRESIFKLDVTAKDKLDSGNKLGL